MATERKNGLGRGLDALLRPVPAPAAAAQESEVRTGEPTVLRLDQMVPGVYQPRTHMDEGALRELADSIRLQGIMQPILVRRLDAASATAKNAAFEIIAGERRFRAARLAGLESVPVLVRDVPNEAAAAMSLIENIQREDLNPLEEAQGLQRLIVEFGMTHETAARAVGRSRSATSNLLRLLNLAEPVQAMLMAGDIDMGHARALLTLDAGMQITAANQIAGRKMSVREAEALVKRLPLDVASVRSRVSVAAAQKSSDLQYAEEALASLLMADVEIRIRKRGKQGRAVKQSEAIVMEFGSVDALKGLIERLRGMGSTSR